MEKKEGTHCQIAHCCHKTIRRSQCHTPQSEILHLLRPPQNFIEFLGKTEPRIDGSVQHPSKRPEDREAATDCHNMNAPV